MDSCWVGEEGYCGEWGEELVGRRGGVMWGMEKQVSENSFPSYKFKNVPLLRRRVVS